MKQDFFSILEWEPFTSIEEAKKKIESLEEHPFIAVHHYFIALPFSFLETLTKEISSPHLTLGSNSMLSITEGTFTQPIASSILKEIQAKFVLLGSHACRIRDSAQEFGKQISLASKERMIPLLCVGETLAELEENRSKEVLSAQLSDALKECTDQDWELLQIVYEAPWINQTAFAPDSIKLNQAYQTCLMAFEELFGKEKLDKIKIHCAIPHDILDLFAYVETIDAPGFYFGKARLSLPLLSEGIPLQLEKPGAEEDSKIVGEAVLSASQETEKLDLMTPITKNNEEDDNKKIK